MDVFPKTKGHTLIIPKKHHRWVYDVPEFGQYWETAHTVTKGIQKALNPKWISYFTYGSVPHAHIHILPRYEDIVSDNVLDNHLIPNQTVSVSKEELQQMSLLIRENI